jgi:hypothetical protein
VTRLGFAPSVAASTAAVLLGSCASPPPPTTTPMRAGIDRRQGAEFVSARAFYGIPMLQKSFFWDGNGEVDTSGIGLHWGRFVRDHTALGLGTNLANWWTGGRDVQSVELEGTIRIYPKQDWPLFVGGNCGYQLANDQIPPGGTLWNFSFGFGAGLDVPIAAGTSALFGVDYHHISNALGHDSPRNPSQNEARLWFGFGWTF